MLRTGILRAGALLLGAGALVACEPTNQGYAPSQPVAYSHAVHAGTSGIDCQYCHFGADRSRYAGIPPASVCMNCHAQVKKDHPEVLKVAAAVEKGEDIPWVKVHYLPDHVHFDHSAHVNADGGGVPCQTCHGPVESMGVVSQWAPLTMGWCVSCHREKSAPLGDPAVPVRASPLTDCYVCHH